MQCSTIQSLRREGLQLVREVREQAVHSRSDGWRLDCEEGDT